MVIRALWIAQGMKRDIIGQKVKVSMTLRSAAGIPFPSLKGAERLHRVSNFDNDSLWNDDNNNRRYAMKTVLLCLSAVIFVVGVAGCAEREVPQATYQAPQVTYQIPQATYQAPQATIVDGKTSKAEIIAALGAPDGVASGLNGLARSLIQGDGGQDILGNCGASMISYHKKKNLTIIQKDGTKLSDVYRIIDVFFNSNGIACMVNVQK